jgi:hypothetical protein
MAVRQSLLCKPLVTLATHGGNVVRNTLERAPGEESAGELGRRVLAGGARRERGMADAAASGSLDPDGYGVRPKEQAEVGLRAFYDRGLYVPAHDQVLSNLEVYFLMTRQTFRCGWVRMRCLRTDPAGRAADARGAEGAGRRCGGAGGR